MEGYVVARFLLSDEKWELIEDVFPPAAPTGRPRRDPQQVLNGILWILRTGAPWRDLPEEFGTWKTCWRMFDRWTSDGTLDLLLTRLQGSFFGLQKLDQQLSCIDGTIVRAARCAAGGGRKGIRRSLQTMHPSIHWARWRRTGRLEPAERRDTTKNSHGICAPSLEHFGRGSSLLSFKPTQVRFFSSLLKMHQPNAVLDSLQLQRCHNAEDYSADSRHQQAFAEVH